MENNELQHWGILGMKWGRRRFQNKDGSLTPEGKRRYDDDPTNDGDSRTKSGTASDDPKPETEKERILRSGSAAEVMKLQGQLTNKELSDAYQRLNNERLISEIAQKEVKTGWDKVADITQKVNKVTDFTQAAVKGYNLLATVNNTFNERQLPKIDGNYFRNRLQNRQNQNQQNQQQQRQNGQTDAQRQQQREQQQNQRQREEEQRQRGYHQENGELVVTNERRYRDTQAQYRELGLRDGVNGQAASNRNAISNTLSRLDRNDPNTSSRTDQVAVRGDNQRSISTTTTRTFAPSNTSIWQPRDYSSAKTRSSTSGNLGVVNTRDSSTGTMGSIRNILSTFSSTPASSITSTGRGSAKRASGGSGGESSAASLVRREGSPFEALANLSINDLKRRYN